MVTAANGTTIDVHTDAEGRMVLADTLYFASSEKPRVVIDYATLTGACIGALSTRLSGAFTNRPDLIPVLERAGEESGERVWPFPLPDDFRESLKSDVADIKQCTLDNDADHILAALFLKRFLAREGHPGWREGPSLPRTKRSPDGASLRRLDDRPGSYRSPFGLAALGSARCGRAIRGKKEFLRSRLEMGVLPSPLSSPSTAAWPGGSTRAMIEPAARFVRPASWRASRDRRGAKGTPLLFRGRRAIRGVHQRAVLCLEG